MDWIIAQAKQPMSEEFAQLREIAAGDPDPLPEPARLAAMRPNAFDLTFAENGQG